MKKIIGVIVVFLILMFTSVVYQITKIIFESSGFGTNLYDNYGKMGVFIEVVIALLSLIIGLWFAKFCWKKITFEEKKILDEESKDETSLSKAVYNHSKDIINGIKPAIDEYKENHISSNSNSQNSNININESKIYEDIMLEIEQDNKIKSIWAKALSLSEGNKDKAESLYINMRFDELKYEPSYKKEESNFENQQEINSNILNKENIEIKRDTSSKKIVFLIVLISILLLACFIIFPLIYFNLNKDASITTNETLPKESTYSPKVQNNNTTINENLNTNHKVEKQDNTNNTSFQQIFVYKDWKYEFFNNFFRIVTNGKVGATGHEFGIIQTKEQCSNNYIWLTFSTINNVQPYIGENVKFKISVDENIFYQELPISNVSKVSSSLYIVAFTNSLLNEYAIASFKKGKKLKVEIIETNKLYDKFDIKYEEFSLEGFVANYLKLNEKCNSSNNKTLFEYVQNNDYGASGLDRTYKLIKNGQSCIYNYSVGYYNGVITDSCTGKHEFQVRDNNGNFVENNDNHWSPLPYHDAFRLMTGNEMKINQKMISTVNSKKELIYCLENMSICKTEKELKANSDSKKIVTEKKTFSTIESAPQYSNNYTTSNSKTFESALSEQECYNKGMYPSKRYSDGSVLCSIERSSHIEYVQPIKKTFESAQSEQECYTKGMYPSKRYSDGSVLCTIDGIVH